MEIITFPTLIYLSLLIISIFFLIGALKRKNRIQVIIFSFCLLFCGLSVFRRLREAYQFKQNDKQCRLASSFSPGDTTSIEGTIYFTGADPYGKQDSINREWNRTGNRLHVMMPLICHGIMMDEIEIIELTENKFDSLSQYLDYTSQKQNSFSFAIKMLVKKIDENYWQFIDTIKITKLSRPPVWSERL
jgi:hypothetical protein